MASVFLSYSREDLATAEALTKAIEEAGHKVWWDRHLNSGSEFASEIEAALEAADIVLVAWSRTSAKSRWVRDEAAAGGDTGRLVPVAIDGALPPIGFRQFHTLDLTGWKGGKKDQRTKALLQAIERRLKGTEDEGPAPRLVGKKRFALPTRKPLWAIAAALVLAIVASTLLFFTTGNQTRGTAHKPTIALLPFTTTSPDGELRNIAAQARASVSHTLSQTGIPVRLVNSGANDSRPAGDFLLSGEIGRSGDKVVATVRLDEAVQGVTVQTTQFEAEGDDIHNLPERIGAQIAGSFSGATLMVLDRRHPLDPALMAELLAAGGDALANYQMAKRVAAKAPDEPSALIGVAFYTGFALPELPSDDRLRAVIEARRAAEKSQLLAPEFGDTYASWCMLHSETRLAECEDRMRVGKRIDPDAPYLNGFLADTLRQVGRFREAMEVTRLSYTHDPYNFFKIRQMLRMLEFAGDREGARELYERAIRWYPDAKFLMFRNRLFALIYSGDFEAMHRIEQEIGADVLTADFPGTGAIAAAVKSKSKPALRTACSPTQPVTLTLRCMIAFAAIGDLDSAYAIADQLYPNRLGRTPSETERIWLDQPDFGPQDFITSPGAAPMRRDPRYLELARRTGLLAYWRSGRPPDFCRKDPEPICRQLLRRS